MQTLTYGTKKPEDGDKGDVFWDALAANAQQFDDHTHNGTNSSKISTAGVTPGTISLLAAGWVSQGGGTYRQLATLTGGRTYDTTKLEVRLSSGHVVLPTIEKVSSTTFYVYVNDNTLDLTVLV